MRIIHGSSDTASRRTKINLKVPVLDTDIRLMAQDIDELKRPLRPAEKRIKGFTKE
jgi:hypothetical protein